MYSAAQNKLSFRYRCKEKESTLTKSFYANATRFELILGYSVQAVHIYYYVQLDKRTQTREDAECWKHYRQ